MSEYTHLGISPSEAARARAKKRLKDKRKRYEEKSRFIRKSEANKRVREGFEIKPDGSVSKIANSNSKSKTGMYALGLASIIAISAIIKNKMKK